MRYFLDMNIPVYFCMQIGHPLEINAKSFIENKKGTFLLCDYVVKINLPKWLNRQKAILFEFNQKTNNSEYDLFSSEQSKILWSQDKIFTNKLLLSYNKNSNKKEFIETINDVFNLLQARISYFIKRHIDEIVIPESSIDFDLKSCLYTWLTPNDSDAKTIASAVQEHKNKPLEIFTSDKIHWTKNLLEEIHNNSKLKKKYPSLPNIKYLQNYKPE